MGSNNNKIKIGLSISESFIDRFENKDKERLNALKGALGRYYTYCERIEDGGIVESDKFYRDLTENRVDPEKIESIYLPFPDLLAKCFKATDKDQANKSYISYICYIAWEIDLNHSDLKKKVVCLSLDKSGIEDEKCKETELMKYDEEAIKSILNNLGH